MIQKFREFAKIVTERSLRVKRGEIIQIRFGIHAFPLAEEIAVAIRASGGFPLLSVTSDSLQGRLIRDVPEEYLAQSPDYWVRWLDDISAILILGGLEDPSELADIPESRLALLSQADEAVREKHHTLHIRSLVAAFPTPESARFYGLPFERFRDLIWDAFFVDYDTLAREGDSLRSALSKGEQLRITSSLGTDISFRLNGRTVWLDDGVFGEDDSTRGGYVTNLPCGEVYISPLEDSVEGRACFPLAIHRGRRIENLTLVFKKGRLETISAKKGEEIVREVLDHATGDKNRLAEFGIGINPKIREPIGYSLADEKIYGSIHLALGENRMYGGENVSDLHWDLVMTAPTVELDGVMLLSEGNIIQGGCDA